MTDSKNGPKSGKFLEVLGSYDARKGAPMLEGEKITAWIAKGAKPSATVHNLMVRNKIVKAKKIDVGGKAPVKKEEAVKA